MDSIIKNSENSPWTINPKFILIKAHYFIFNAGVASSITFGSTIAKQIGYSAVTVGFMYTCFPLLGLCAKILCGALADKCKLRKLCFFLAVSVCLLCSFIMIFIPTVSPAKRAYLLCHDLSYINSCNDMVGSSRIDAYMETDPNVTIRCELDCDISTEFNNETCFTWLIQSRCSKSDGSFGANGSISSKNTVSHRLPTSGSEELEIHQSTNPDHLRFTAFLPHIHIHTTGSCINAQIREVQVEGADNIIIPFCKKYFNSTCMVKCDNSRLASVLGGEESVADDFVKLGFWLLFLLYALIWCGMALTYSLSDTVCFDILGNEPEKFGVQRMFGALGWGLITLSSGSLVDWFSGNSSDKNYRILYYIGCIMLSLDLYIVYRLKIQQKVISVTVFKDVRVLFHNFRTVIFTMWCILTGILMGVSWQFLYWHLEDISDPEDLQWSKTLQGLDSLFTTVIGELPFFLIAGKIIQFCGYIHTMTIVLIACALRMFAYSNLTRPVWVLPIELISGFTFSMCYVLTASYSSRITIPGTESTVQGLFGAMFDGLGASLGGFIGGIIYHQFGGSILFGTLAYTCAFAAIAHHYLQRALKPTRSHNIRRGTNGDLSAHYASPNEAITILERS